ncbi:hypothetical protein SAMN02745135_01568 [Caloranaerobacter azorensis DSM 13643]|uniref:Lipoprotein n=1 Tax=Caloranaerobacter azorensis DSM 13643 TaxID=1121264 RepID=A0A1M5USS6_9FIRM|nr:hypothetical protein [Caloranaerobacter azorensis]SHH65960.1 hypothetical protein SAMN02745135_01568 [Caloranaerobacter azorensis DSM 13643]
MPKKILVVTLVILMIFSLIACSQQNKDIDNNKDHQFTRLIKPQSHCI